MIGFPFQIHLLHPTSTLLLGKISTREGCCLLNQRAVSHSEATEASLQIKALPLMDHEPTVHPQRTCTGALPLEDPGWQQSHYD